MIEDNIDLDDYIELFLSGVFHPEIPWNQHVLEYTKSNRFDLLVVTYKNLKEEPLSQLRRVMEFVSGETDPELLETAVEASRFDKMRELEKLQMEENRDLHGSRKDILRTRKGKSQGWKELFSDAQVSKLVSCNREGLEAYQRLCRETCCGPSAGGAENP